MGAIVSSMGENGFPQKYIGYLIFSYFMFALIWPSVVAPVVALEERLHLPTLWLWPHPRSELVRRAVLYQVISEYEHRLEAVSWVSDGSILLFLLFYLWQVFLFRMAKRLIFCGKAITAVLSPGYTDSDSFPDLNSRDTFEPLV